jgi:hypothetical protein
MFFLDQFSDAVVLKLPERLNQFTPGESLPQSNIENLPIPGSGLDFSPSAFSQSNLVSHSKIHICSYDF